MPGAAALVVGVVVKLVNDDIVDFGLFAIAQRDVGEDFGGAAEDGRAAVDGGVDVWRVETAVKRRDRTKG